MTTGYWWRFRSSSVAWLAVDRFNFLFADYPGNRRTPAPRHLGGLHNFQEVFIDEGEANFIEVIRILRDSGYSWSICPDHVQKHPADPKLSNGFAHGFGYIQALIDASNSEVK